MNHRWSRVSEREKDKWAEGGKDPLETMRFEFFLYVPKDNQKKAKTTMMRATMRRIEEASERIREHERNNNIQFGPIERQHLTIVNARRLDTPGGEILVPNDNTTRQARALDEARQQLEQERTENNQLLDNNLRNIRMSFNGVFMEVPVDIRSLRTALGLPQYDLFHRGIFEEYKHPELDEDDNIEDVDHQDD